MSKEKETKEFVESLLWADPSETSLDIYKYVQEHKLFFHKEFENFIKQFEVFFNDMNELVVLLNYVPKDDWPYTKKIQYLMFPETMKTLHRAFEDLNDGYYDESMMLNRSIYETFLRIVFISCFPNDHESVFIKPEKGKVTFNVSNFPNDILKLKWDFLYRIMSAIHHSKKHRVLSEIISRQSDPNQIVRLLYQSDKNFGMPMCVNIIMFNLACLFHALVSIFYGDFDNSEKTKPKKERWLNVNKAFLMIISCNPKPDFANLSKDLEKIGNIIRMANEKKDWRSLC
ncbi:MAG: hypothetical protein A3G32_07180 [Deltaproteobacteria bacterium RIFCSPLOWO2_12_FULL_40_28]|nr:MAG: hypothetical protein A3C45_07225 [Deltaproteobacteria bacterium RIFCSPHIGHO2_02_FULL_40_28]OGQ19262.1 MAG: hypothetical protein A3E27_04590 [Deltaproteobacteria bacterium RIFCSPHIGHO2_12_FULL_40_32]OGQ40515.1 MAG: hypothetical protein A3I69_00480 [Deltaproteobacteria bacterium RIFCSPLOWO2_02_FULL_40_36]OGQ53750.1 MAG: hypothetical protein A3G32_07180 [Deltaproteobacteria bacterium RIFCSPLOWO2_12_FULL_40_28]